MNAIRDQLAFLRDRAQAISSGIQKIDGSLRQRAGLYANAARSAFWQVRTRIHDATGDDEERRELGDAEHCEDCIGYAEMGWQPIGTLPEPGEASVCRSRCKCGKSYRNSREAA
jgi:hypothetical protein